MVSKANSRVFSFSLKCLKQGQLCGQFQSIESLQMTKIDRSGQITARRWHNQNDLIKRWYCFWLINIDVVCLTVTENINIWKSQNEHSIKPWSNLAMKGAKHRKLPWQSENSSFMSLKKILVLSDKKISNSAVAGFKTQKVLKGPNAYTTPPPPTSRHTHLIQFYCNLHFSISETPTFKMS